MDDDELYIQTLTLDQAEVREAIKPGRYSMAQDVATHGAQIASLFMGMRSQTERLASLEHDRGPVNSAIDSMSADIVEVKRQMRFLYHVLAAGLLLILLAAWIR